MKCSAHLYTITWWKWELASLDFSKENKLSCDNRPAWAKRKEGESSMAYFMFRAQIISKSNKSAVAASAYRSGESLYSERDGLTKKYKEREVKPETYILSPEHAPDWVNDRNILWNEVEKIEKQHNSQLAREIVFSLPQKLNDQEQTNLTIDFCKENFSDEGMVADISIHRDKEHNPHAHVMLTLRPFNENGEWGKKATKEYILDENGDFSYTKKGNKRSKRIDTVDWNKEETLKRWRKNFAEKTNEKFKELGIEDRVSHESYEKQGINKIPKIRLSREAYQLEKREQNKAKTNNEKYEAVTYYGKLNQEISEINKEINELKKEKVISLEEHKNKKQNISDFEAIRKNTNFSDQQKSSMQMIAKRAKSYVDYAVAKKVYFEIKKGNWSKSINTKKEELQAEKNLINKIHKTYKDNPKNVVKYGVEPKNYSKIMQEKIFNLKEKESNYKDLSIKYDRVQKKAELGYEVQKDILNKEFNYLYKDQERFNSDEKYLAVQYFKDYGRTLDKEKIKDYASNHELKTERPTITAQTNNISKSIFIVEKGIEKYKREKKQHFHNRDFNKVYEADKKIEQYNLRLKALNRELQGNIHFLQARLHSNYKDKNIEMVSRPETLVKLYELNKSGKSSSNLTKDLKKLQKAMDKEKQTNKEFNKDTGQKQINKSYANHVSNSILQSIEDIRKGNEQNKPYDLNRTKKRRRGRYEKDHENEI